MLLWLHRTRKCETWMVFNGALNQADDQKVKPLAFTNKPIDKRQAGGNWITRICGILPRITSICVECSGIFPCLRTRRNKPIEKWTKHIHWCRVQPVGTNIWTCGCWKYLKGKEGLCTQWCATVYQQDQCENQKKCPTVISFQWLLDNRANSAEGEGTPRLKRLDVSRTPILLPDHFIKTLNYNQQPIGADESRTPIPWLYFFI